MKWGWAAALLWVAGCDPGTGATEAVPETPDAHVARGHGGECGECHAEIEREWLGSRHHDAFANDVFQAEWGLHRQAACVRCHAPGADPEAPEGAAADEGIGCTTCHANGGAAAEGVAACASCHDFPFTRVGVASETLLQATVHEHEAVATRGDCARCHMPRIGTHRSHAFLGPRDPELWSRALDVDVSAAAGAGHAVPTGDMHRRLVVRARLGGHVEEAVLRRRFERRVEVGDDRVPAGGSREVTLGFPARARDRVEWEIEWQALDPVVAFERGLAEREVRRVVAEGSAVVAR